MSSGRGKQSEKDLRRAPRFRLELPTSVWALEGSARAPATRTRTKDISRTGVYLHGDFSEPEGSAISFELELPAPFGGDAGCLLRGHGRIVRFETRRNKRVGIAATLERFELIPPPKKGDENVPGDRE